MERPRGARRLAGGVRAGVRPVQAMRSARWDEVCIISQRILQVRLTSSAAGCRRVFGTTVGSAFPLPRGAEEWIPTTGTIAAMRMILR